MILDALFHRAECRADGGPVGICIPRMCSGKRCCGSRGLECESCDFLWILSVPSAPHFLGKVRRVSLEIPLLILLILMLIIHSR